MNKGARYGRLHHIFHIHMAAGGPAEVVGVVVASVQDLPQQQGAEAAQSPSGTSFEPLIPQCHRRISRP